LGKVGSGEHTSTGLSRAEAREAMDLMLAGQASEAQLGAFLIAHRIRRPLPIELAGMLESYRHHGPTLVTPGRRALCFGVPYDGRSRTAPLLPLVALVLAAAGLPVVLDGGGPMPVKYGVTLAERLQPGIHWVGLSLAQVQDRLDRHGLALDPPTGTISRQRSACCRWRDAIGKRPPVASLELLWTPHQGDHLLISGFVHPPTEARAWEGTQRLRPRRMCSRSRVWKAPPTCPRPGSASPPACVTASASGSCSIPVTTASVARRCVGATWRLGGARPARP
jgi:anthranilate phosphoribosyltransferase